MTATATSTGAPRKAESTGIVPEDRTKTSLLLKLVQTGDDRVATFLRLVLGIVMLPHGAQKMFGWFGGYGFNGTLGFMTQQLHIPEMFAVLAIVAEFAGALGLITGLLSRVAASGILAIMLVAVALVHSHVGFFMNWGGTLKGEGFEYHLLAIGIAVAVIINGGGAWSVDRLLSRKA
jgi:putative oxidoreductase